MKKTIILTASSPAPILLPIPQTIGCSTKGHNAELSSAPIEELERRFAAGLTVSGS